MTPPRTRAARTCKWIRLSGPIQVAGVIHSATATPVNHSTASKMAKIRSVRR